MKKRHVDAVDTGRPHTHSSHLHPAQEFLNLHLHFSTHPETHDVVSVWVMFPKGPCVEGLLSKVAPWMVVDHVGRGKVRGLDH